MSQTIPGHSSGFSLGQEHSPWHGLDVAALFGRLGGQEHGHRLLQLGARAWTWYLLVETAKIGCDNSEKNLRALLLREDPKDGVEVLKLIGLMQKRCTKKISRK